MGQTTGTQGNDALAVYVVQVATYEDDDDVRTWEDIGEVSVPSRTHRSTVIEKAVAQNPQIVSGNGRKRLRVIPLSHALPILVEMEQPPPQLKIVGA